MQGDFYNADRLAGLSQSDFGQARKDWQPLFDSDVIGRDLALPRWDISFLFRNFTSVLWRVHQSRRKRANIVLCLHTVIDQ